MHATRSGPAKSKWNPDRFPSFDGRGEFRINKKRGDESACGIVRIGACRSTKPDSRTALCRSAPHRPPLLYRILSLRDRFRDMS
ncbi:hypothetical protein C7S17_6244 [Burkholderia thailandensis]|nr:hypothetical protein [Burkholderia thailandensis]